MIWCLFSIDDNYDQPDNNLLCWWSKKPSLEVLANALGFNLGDDDETTVSIVHVWTGKSAYIGGTSYRMETVEEGKVL